MENISISDTELLKFAIENGMIDAALVQEKIEMQKKIEILNAHPYKIWEGKDGNWYTYLPDEERERVLKKRKSEKAIEDCVVEYYREIEQHPCFRETYEKWIAEKEEFQEIGLNSITRYDNDFARFFPRDEPFCKIRLCDMTDSELERFIKRTIREKNLTSKSYAMLRLIITGVFKYAKREGYTDYSISTFFSDLSLPSNIFKKRVKDNSLEVFNKQESNDILRYLIENPTLVNLGIIIGFFSGLRVGELSALKLKDNEIRNVIKVRRTEIVYKDKTIGKRITSVKEYPKTDSGVREVIIPGYAQEIMDRIASINPDGEFLFMKDNTRITERMFNYYLKKACKSVGITPRSTHKVRKTYGSLLLINDVDAAIVLRQMGHKDISTTQAYYHYDISTDAGRQKLINIAVNY